MADTGMLATPMMGMDMSGSEPFAERLISGNRLKIAVIPNHLKGVPAVDLVLDAHIALR